MRIRSARFQNFRGLRDYSVSLREMNVLVGPNNAGKSSILDGFRTLASAVRHAKRRNPTLLSVNRETFYGWEVPPSTLPISLANVHSDYDDTAGTTIVFTVPNGNKLQLAFYESSRCILTVIEEGPPTRSAGAFKSRFPLDLVSFPTLGPLEEEEQLRSPEYVEQNRGTRRAHRLFRNIWHQDEEKFGEFQALLARTWPGMTIEKPTMVGYAPPTMVMLYNESRKPREVYWAGFGFQIWLQIISHFLLASRATTLIVDEPEIYLHPDLQHRLFDLLKGSGKQVLLATHSVEIVNEAEQDDVVLVNRARRSAKRVADIEGLQEALFSIGSAQNIHLARLSKGKRVLFFEGDDYKLLKRIGRRLNLESLAGDVGVVVVPIGGFGQLQKIEDAAWTFEKVLKADIEIAAVLDRDYRSSDEIQKITDTVRQRVPRFHILGAKEVENYLLSPFALSRALNERLAERRGAVPNDASLEAITERLERVCEAFRNDIVSQLVANKMRFVGRLSTDPATLMNEALAQVDNEWLNLSDKLRIVPGKKVLRALSTELQQEYSVSLTHAQIARNLDPLTMPVEFVHILSDLNDFAESAAT
jgi:energy-coupling factor transporter ATP-binding protein EcfA2